MDTILVTGSSQGLGFSFVKKYLERGAMVFATMRNTDNSDIRRLQEAYPETLVPITMDVSDTRSVDEAFAAVGARTPHLDIVISNAGISPPTMRQPLEEVDVDAFLSTINTNALGGLRVARRAVPLLRKGEGKCFVNISSAGASFKHIIDIDTWQDEFPYAYCMSKAAQNMGAAILQRYVKADGIKVLCFHPGLLISRMWNPEVQPYGDPRITTDESAELLLKVIRDNQHDIGGPLFLNYTGEVFPY